MRCSGKLATFVLVCSLEPGCHKTLPPPPVVPAAQTPPAEQTPTTPPPATPQTLPRPRTTPPPTAPPTPEPTPPPQPEFRLGQALSPEELRTNNALIDEHLRRAARALASIGNRPLTNEQKTSVAQIRGFMEQARQMRGTDVLRARSLAERADVLTQDLVSRLR